MKLKGKIHNIIPNGKSALLILEVGDLELLETEHTNYIQKELDIELTEHKVKRSLRANAYMWQLCTSISRKIGVPKEDVYREHIRRTQLPVITSLNDKGIKVLNDFMNLSSIGWFYEELSNDDQDGFKTIAIYYGSSTYNTKQMSDLINDIVDEAKHLGVETLTPQEQANLINLIGDK